MPTSPRAACVAAFLLLALIVLLLLAPAHAADPFRLDRVAIVRFTPSGADTLLRQQGVLFLDGRTTWRPATEIARPANTPDYALNRPLIATSAYSAYLGLGTFVLQGFLLHEGAVTLAIGDESFKAITHNPEKYVHDGSVINLSTRATLSAAGPEIVAGFVIEGRPRAVLVRVVGPGLARFGVTNHAADPFLSLKRNGQAFLLNDNWSADPDAALVAAAAAHVGAFPLEPGAKDAARVVILEPGAYTVHAESASAAAPGGQVLLEIYRLPDDAIYEANAGR